MGTTVQLWSGAEVRALRAAKRMSLQAFADHLGVTERMVSKWEKAGAAITPRPVNQHALDSSLSASGADVQARFNALIPEKTVPMAGDGPSSGPELELLLDGPQQVRHPIDGKLMTLVEAGVFLAGELNEPRWLPAFYIDVFPTTNADYARFVAATGHASPQGWLKGSNPPDNLFDHPVVFVTWRDAVAYSQWSAKGLPSSEQWEKAARGTRGDIYPWGSQLTPAKCNVRESGIRGTTPVSRYHSGVSPYGVYDLCGNVWEWCAGESSVGRSELKGSAFTSPFFRCTPSNFNDASVDMFDDDTGFRCVTPAETMRALLNRIV